MASESYYKLMAADYLLSIMNGGYGGLMLGGFAPATGEALPWQPDPNNPKDWEAPFGRCGCCDAPVTSRTKDFGGRDRCERGHVNACSMTIRENSPKPANVEQVVRNLTRFEKKVQSRAGNAS